MINVMGYDGFRYDMTLGYNGKYLSMYNEAAQPYFSVSELWSDVTTQVNHLKATDYNTLIFDFPLKFSLQNALGNDGSVNETRYNLLKNPANSLRNRGYKRYAVTFIDNHDTFERSDNQGSEFISYNANLSNAVVRRRILEANAYILLIPGVPCVFYPHWVSYKEEINTLIAARKKAGIHSESEIVETSSYATGNRSYEATVYGHRGTIILRMGVNRSKEAPEGFETLIEGDTMGTNFTVFYSNAVQGVESIQPSEVSRQKFIKDGQLLIQHGDRMYDVMGREVN